MIQNKLIRNLGICFVLVILMSNLVSAGFLDWFVELFSDGATGYISASPNQCLNHEDVKSKIESVNAKLDILIGNGEEVKIEEEVLDADEGGGEEAGDVEGKVQDDITPPNQRELGGPCDPRGICGGDLFCLKDPRVSLGDGVCVEFEKRCESDEDCEVCTLEGVCSTSFTCSGSEFCSWAVD